MPSGRQIVTVSGEHHVRTLCSETIAPPSISQTGTMVGLLHRQRHKIALVSSEQHVMMSKSAREGKRRYLFLMTQEVGAISQSDSWLCLLAATQRDVAWRLLRDGSRLIWTKTFRNEQRFKRERKKEGKGEDVRIWRQVSCAVGISV